LLDLYRRPDGSEWGGQDLENATAGAVTRSYVANLKKVRIEDPGLAKLEAISGAMGFPPSLWFGNGEKDERAPGDALLAALGDDTMRAIVEETLRQEAAAEDGAPDRFAPQRRLASTGAEGKLPGAGRGCDARPLPRPTGAAWVSSIQLRVSLFDDTRYGIAT
jgi:transcriptional regulator with XRE-family HTH domain